MGRTKHSGDRVGGYQWHYTLFNLLFDSVVVDDYSITVTIKYGGDDAKETDRPNVRRLLEKFYCH